MKPLKNQKVSVRAALTPKKVQAARAMRRNGATQNEIALKFGVSQATVSNLLTGKNYREVA